jgi:hypothetical protein
MQVSFTDMGYLHIPVEIARDYFPEDVLVALLKDQELWLLPVRGAAAGGLLLKQRNLQGDRSVIIWEAVQPHTPLGARPAVWDEQHRALRVALEAMP